MGHNLKILFLKLNGKHGPQTEKFFLKKLNGKHGPQTDKFFLKKLNGKHGPPYTRAESSGHTIHSQKLIVWLRHYVGYKPLYKMAAPAPIRRKTVGEQNSV